MCAGGFSCLAPAKAACVHHGVARRQGRCASRRWRRWNRQCVDFRLDIDTRSPHIESGVPLKCIRPFLSSLSATVHQRPPPAFPAFISHLLQSRRWWILSANTRSSSSWPATRFSVWKRCAFRSIFVGHNRLAAVAGSVGAFSSYLSLYLIVSCCSRLTSPKTETAGRSPPAPPSRLALWTTLQMCAPALHQMLSCSSSASPV